MGDPKIISEEAISLYDLKKQVTKIKKRDKELGFRVTKVDDYLNDYIVLKQKEYKELEKNLNSLDVPRIKDKHIKKIMDLLPKTVDQLKIIIQGYALTVSQKNMKKIVKVVKEFAE
ncbi:MAG: hypothetical protein MAG795_00459 [Candidatus Woesearchaeota archaeon]|nr:hypothetical protein [Candidatus Woesearchaeota archaeon]